MSIKTVEIKPARLSPIECKMCGDTATHLSYDTKGNDVGPSIYHCRKCAGDAKAVARFFITPHKAMAPARSIEDFLA